MNDKNVIKALKLQKRLFNIINACYKVALLKFFNMNQNLKIIKFRNEIKIIAKLKAKS